VLDDGQRRLATIGLNLVPFAGIAFLWFIGVVRDRIGAREDRFFATVFLGSGLLFVAMLFCAAALGGGLVNLPDGHDTDPELWTYGRRVTYSLMSVYGMRMAGVFMMSTTTLLMRLQIVPRWLVAVGFLGAVTLLLTTGSLPYVELVFPAWVLVLSTMMLIATLRTHDAAAPLAPTT
jgi:hypothetical protein